MNSNQNQKSDETVSVLKLNCIYTKVHVLKNGVTKIRKICYMGSSVYCTLAILQIIS